ncbi:ABC transporter ATP-binding protein [Pengzhenrongella sicca]|uniref:ATP-binding cassette domain-containing protein n=1 Tax=Pengzhenrongella sicca TaxID=2819238 RepID=A0A8A4ZGH0_9MICO|nr:ATP-binding cassette domain-containing protein [Pengzhenrongella sicca]QTE29626.1 ATP-binding cassette domain-containing protein [Pengzhenrongella sicca]
MADELVLTEVTRRFGARTALDAVSFRVRPGRLTGFVGANGAGKTTAMRIVMGVLAADAGSVELGGRPLDLAARRRFGYMPEERGLYPKMKIAEQLVYLGRVHGLDRATAASRTAELLESLGLADRAHEQLSTLSLGNQQRVQVAAALVHDPVLLVLDEPFSGLDPLAVDRMAEQLRERAAAGVPVLFSSHQLELVERLCDDVVIIGGGRIRAAGPATDLRRDSAARRVRVVVGGVVAARVVEAATAVPGVRSAVADGAGQAGPGVVVDLDAGADDQALLAAAASLGPVREFHPLVPTLAETFREVVR